MKYTFKDMRIHYANQIKDWQYEGYLKDIYMNPYFDNYNESTGEMKGPLNCDGFAVFKGVELFGLFEYYHKDGVLEIGLAINPIFVGKGYSKDFILEGIAFGVKEFKYSKNYILLSVEKDNIQAYKAYLKVGFKEYQRDTQEIMMKYDLK